MISPLFAGIIGTAAGSLYAVVADVTPAFDLNSILLAVIAATPPSILAYATLRQSRITAKSVDGVLTKYVAATKGEAHAEGKAEGKAEERKGKA